MSTASEITRRSEPPSDPFGLKAGDLIDGRFRLMQLLGIGGMGVVWQAEDEELDEIVAFKFLPRELQKEPKALDDLRRETARCHRLSHPNIVRTFDFHMSEACGAYISMEYTNGTNLNRLRWGSPYHFFRWDFLAPLIMQLCDALDYAHSENVIHRDLKPANLILDNNGRLKLADFGIAALVTDPTLRLPPSPRITGTLAYMSPQQLSGLTPQPTDDFYSLGATLYDLLSGHPPFFRGEIVQQIRETIPEPISRRLRRFGLRNEIPTHVEALVLACLAKRTERRPPNAASIKMWISPGSRLGIISSRLRGWWNRLSSTSRPGGQS